MAFIREGNRFVSEDLPDLKSGVQYELNFLDVLNGNAIVRLHGEFRQFIEFDGVTKGIFSLCTTSLAGLNGAAQYIYVHVPLQYIGPRVKH